MTLEEMADRIASQPLQRSPFPYIVADDVLPPHILTGLRQWWPGAETFSPETPGNYTSDPRTLVSENSGAGLFWSHFTRDVAPVIARASLGHFAEWIIARYGPVARRIVASKFRLMQADPSYAGIPCHAHHWQTPTWCVTLLLYVDQEADGHQGTTLHALTSAHGVPSLDVASRFAARSLHGNRDRGSTWNGSGLMDEYTANYKGNRLIAFLDGPLSYHSVKPVDTVGHSTRRVFRVHLGMPRTDLLYQLLYGVTEQGYVSRRVHGADDPGVIAWLRRDIAQVWQTSPSLSAHVRARWTKSLKLTL
jgi:hypothetical protein